MMLNEGPSWSVDVPGLDSSGARILLDAAAAIPGTVQGSAVDPAVNYSRHFDRETALVLKLSLETTLRNGVLTSDQRMVAAGVLEDVADWLLATSDAAQFRAREP